MGKKLLIILTILLIIPIASAIETYKLGEDIHFIHTITSNNEPVDNIVANISITNPQETLIVAFQPMTYIASNKTFNYTLSHTLVNITGTYERCIFATNGTDWAEPTCFEFEITRSGTKLDSAEGLTQIFLLLIIIGLFSFSLFGAIKISSKNPRNEWNEIIDINYKKYMKYGLFGLSYLFFVWIIFVSWNLAYGYLNFQALATAFFYLYRLLFALSLPVFLFIMIMIFLNLISDKRMEKYFNAGVSSLTP